MVACGIFIGWELWSLLHSRVRVRGMSYLLGYGCIHPVVFCCGLRSGSAEASSLPRDAVRAFRLVDPRPPPIAIAALDLDLAACWRCCVKGVYTSVLGVFFARR